MFGTVEEIMSVSSSSKINNPKKVGEDDVTEVTPLHSSQGENVEKDMKKDKTKQHLLSDWRTAISNQPRVKQPGCQNMEACQGNESIRIQEAVYPSQEIRQMKAVSRFVSDNFNIKINDLENKDR